MKTENVVIIKSRLKIFKGFPMLAPYISVFFILLLFIMIGSQFTPISGINIDLPVAHTKTIDATRRFIVTVDKNGVIYFNDVPIPSMDVLRRHIVEGMMNVGRRENQELESLVIRADRVNSLETIAQLFSLAEELNINAVLMASSPKSSNDTVFMETEK